MGRGGGGREGGDGWLSRFEIHCGSFKIVSELRALGRTCAEDSASPVVFSRADVPNRF